MGSKAAPTTTSTTKQELSPEMKSIFDMFMPYAKEHAGKDIGTYGGSTVAGFTPEQLEAQKKYTGAVGTVDALAGQSADSQKFMLSTDQLNHGSNPYISGIADQITGKIQKGLVEKSLPMVRSGSIGQGGMYAGGSTRGMLAEGKAVGDAASATGDALQKLYFDNYQSGINNIARAQQMNPGIMSQQLFGADILGAVGGQKQAMEQALQNEQLQKWIQENYGSYFKAQEIAGLMGMMPNTGTVTSTNTGALPQKSKAAGALGGAISGAGAGAAFGPLGAGIGGVLGGLGGYFG